MLVLALTYSGTEGMNVQVSRLNLIWKSELVSDLNKTMCVKPLRGLPW